MPTVIGVIFMLCAICCFLFSESSLFGLLILSSVFQAASAINLGERGIPPYYVVAFFIVARALLNRILGNQPARPMPHGKWLLGFGTTALLSAFVLPIVFAGMPVYDPKIGIDDGLLIHPPLALNLNNVVQASYLCFQLATAFALLALRFSLSKTRQAFLWAFYIEVGFLVAESLCQLTGITFPLSLVLNNPGYGLWTAANEVNGTRNPGTFAEPSATGAFLVVYCVGFLADYLAGSGKASKVIVGVIASGLAASSSSLVTLGLAPILLTFRYGFFRFPCYINRRQLHRIGLILCLLGVPTVLALVFLPGYREVITGLTVTKEESGSFINRTASDLFALQLVVRSYGFGVGLGSNRASSLLTTLISNVGVAGVLSFAIFYYKTFAGLARENAWLKWAGAALLFNMILGIADVTMPLLWIPIFLATQLYQGHQNSLEKTRRGHAIVAT